MDIPLGLASYEFFTGQFGSSGVDSHPDTGPVTTTIPRTVTLDGWTYAIDIGGNQYEFGPQDTFRDGVVASDQPNDSLFNARGAWMRYRYGWHHGADQEIADLDDSADAFRFDQSYGFDVWDRYKLKLLPLARVNDDGFDVSSGAPILLRSGEYMWLANGSLLNRSTTGGSLVGTSVTEPGGTIRSLASDGNDLYVAASSGVTKYVGTDTTPAVFGTPITGSTHKVAFVGNRLLIGQANVLSEVGATGTLTAIETHYQTAFRWTAVFAIGSRIYFGGYAGVKSELYAATVDSTGALVKGQEAAPFPIGERLLCALSYGGSVLLGTSAGIRFAQTGADGTLTYGPLIEAPGEVYSICAEGRFAWFTWNNIDTLSGRRGVGRLDLATFVDVLQPAYAQDVLAVADENLIVGVERFEGYTWFLAADSGVYYAADDGVFQDYTTLATEAVITSGRFFFGTVEPKGLVELEVVFDELPAGASVEVSVFDDAGGLVGYGVQAQALTSELRVAMSGEQTREVSVQLVVVQPSGSQVTVRNWRLRAYPSPPQVLQWLAPLNTHQSVLINDGEGEAMPQGIRDVVDRIETLHRSRRLVNYSEGGRLYRVRVESFQHKPSRWTDDGLALQGVCLVQLVSA